MKKVITYGTFDLFHQGHFNLLNRAKALGDYLIVGVTSEAYDKYRGKLNVQQSLMERIENVRNIGLVDEVLVEEYEGQKLDDIQEKNIDVFVIGSDWMGRFDYIKEYCEVVYLERTRGISSTQLRNTQMKLTQFGIVGSGRIANRFITECKYISGVTVEGVFGIHTTSIEKFANEHELSFYTTDYAEFLNQVTAVYIASPHETHYEYAKEAILQGKHVLCEKPMALKEKQAKELFELAKEHKVILLEAIKTAYCPGFQRLVSCAKSGKIGSIKNVEASFTKLVSQNSRELNSEVAAGSLFELGTYPLLAIFSLLGYDFKKISFISYENEKKVDLFTKVELLYSTAVASAKVGLGVKGEGDLIISGTRGYIYVPAPWWKTEYFELRFENFQETEKHFYKYLGDGLRYEIVSFLQCILEGKIPPQQEAYSVYIAGVLEAFKRDKNKYKID